MDVDKCLSCNLSRFGNLRLKKDDLMGGELFVLEQSIDQKRIFPCQLVCPLDAGFRLLLEVYNSLDMDTPHEGLDSSYIRVMPPMLFFAYQSFFDLKASVFLALAAHYRSAIQLLRPVLENIVLSKYFQEKLRRADKEWEKEYENFLTWSKQEDHHEGFNNSLLYLESIKINPEEKMRINELWVKLNKYEHPYMFKWDKGATPEIVCYNEFSFNEWLNFYQNIISYLIELICYYFPEEIRTQYGRDALIELKGMESSEIDCEMKFIISEYLRNFLSKISSDGNLPHEAGLAIHLTGLPNPDENSET
ncbi:hypothetical protein [Methanothrix sp.]|uniref:hypothetical protein n=1 Tax=Methanothrix sp. TaxID=90426 RepID=UPI00329782CC